MVLRTHTVLLLQNSAICYGACNHFPYFRLDHICIVAYKPETDMAAEKGPFQLSPTSLGPRWFS